MILELALISLILFIIAELIENNHLLILVVSKLAQSNNQEPDDSHPKAKRRLNFN